MSISNDESIHLQILYLSSVSWKITPLYLFSSNNIYFAQNYPIKILYPSSNFASIFSFMRDYSCSFLAQAIYTLLKRSSLKWKFLRLSSASVKFCQIPYANFETSTWFLSKFCIPLQFHERLFLCTFLAQTIYTLLKRSPLKWKFLRLSSAQVKFCQIPYVNLKQRVDSSTNFLSLVSFMKDNPSILV